MVLYPPAASPPLKASGTKWREGWEGSRIRVGALEQRFLSPSGISQSPIPESSHYTTTLYCYTVKYEI